MNEIELKGYNSVMCNSNSTRTGGVIVYIRNNWKFKKIMEKSIESKIWMVACECRCENVVLVLINIYRSPNSSSREFVELLKLNLEPLLETSKEIIMTGDFDIDWSKNEPIKREIK